MLDVTDGENASPSIASPPPSKPGSVPWAIDKGGCVSVEVLSLMLGQAFYSGEEDLQCRRRDP